jgi:hypothetical protein
MSLGDFSQLDCHGLHLDLSMRRRLKKSYVLLTGKTLDGVMGISSLLLTFLSRSRADIGALEELLLI